MERFRRSASILGRAILIPLLDSGGLVWFVMVSAVLRGGLSPRPTIDNKSLQPAASLRRAGLLDRAQASLLKCRVQKGAPGEGKRVQIPRGPAAVTGYETRRRHCLSA